MQRSYPWPMLLANAPTNLPEMLQASCDAAEQELRFFEAASSEAGKPKLKKFSGVAYTGGAMRANYGFPVAVDLSGLTVASASIPSLKDHDPTQIVGHLSAEIGKRSIKVEGSVSGVGPAAQEVQALSANDFPWQMSVGVQPSKVEFIERGDRQVVNGKAVDGPAYVIRAGVLREVSFVAIGADAGTSGRVDASLCKEQSMGFEAWLKAKGFGDLTLTAEQKATLKAAYDREVQAAGQPAGGNPGANPPANQPPANPAPAPTPIATPVQAAGHTDLAAEFAALRAELQAERAGQQRQVVLAEYRDRLPAERFQQIEAAANTGGWDRNRTELELLRAARPTGPAIHVSAGGDVSQDVLLATVCRMGNLPNLEATFTDQQLQASHTRFRRGISLHELFLFSAWRNGYTGVSVKSDPEGVLRAAFSSYSIAGLLSNIANKFLLAGYTAVEDSWRQIAARRSVNDFKAVTSYRLTADMKFEKVGPDGELKNGELGEASFTNKADTYGKILGITRKDFINDDLGALTQVPTQLGRGAALGLNDIFWSAYMANSDFFKTDNKNYSSGAATALSIDSLSSAELLFYNQTCPNGEPLGATPAILLHPNALSVKATQLHRDTEIRDTTVSTKYTTSNPHAGKFRPVRSSYLHNTKFTGHSTLAWYLLADPNDIPVIEVAFLNGSETPVIESAEADFSMLGVQMRGYYDFGVALQDFRGGVKMKGEN